MTIEDVVEEVPEEKLDWALQQVENSIVSMEKKKNDSVSQ
jgi:hypothetical protein